MALDYYKIFVEMGERHIELTKQQKTVEVELAKLTETIQHIFKMLTPAQQRKAQKVIERIEGPKGGLKQGVVMALRANSRLPEKHWVRLWDLWFRWFGFHWYNLEKNGSGRG